MEGDGKREHMDMDSPTNSQQTISDDDEIDYSVKPEFYDSGADDKDELWVQKQRTGRDSDAVLSCPACFTTLCLQCQRNQGFESSIQHTTTDYALVLCPYGSYIIGLHFFFFFFFLVMFDYYISFHLFGFCILFEEVMFKNTVFPLRNIVPGSKS
ncbi:uncharacterized protein LOC116134048 isoform X2 [Pistacia vera]|uniref:uncharacterized protein LOC116134048 isoform X2 n=1 Tax=Pistacia vera TaxID=55513 RepID=UPI00126309CA|nr:uncharacterized protein LOC116134048 isoform X2 [Pistacia vera]